jgi:hypothetical protein
MIKKIVYLVLPLVAPFILYAIYALLAKRGKAAGKRWDDTPWYWLTAAGVACMIASLSALVLTSGAPPDADTYTPAQLRDDGKIEPSRFD